MQAGTIAPVGEDFSFLKALSFRNGSLRPKILSTPWMGKKTKNLFPS